MASNISMQVASNCAIEQFFSEGKRVSFGPYISPEYIDKHLPSSTPVKKGAAPPNGSNASQSTPTSSLLKKSMSAMAAATSTVRFFLPQLEVFLPPLPGHLGHVPQVQQSSGA